MLTYDCSRPRVDTDRDGWVQMNYEQFMKVCRSRAVDDAISSSAHMTDRSQRTVIAAAWSPKLGLDSLMIVTTIRYSNSDCNVSLVMRRWGSVRI